MKRTTAQLKDIETRLEGYRRSLSQITASWKHYVDDGGLLALQLDRLDNGSLKASSARKEAEVLRGPKWGVSSIVQGGSPGLGKRR